MKVIDSLVIMILVQFQKYYGALGDRASENEKAEKASKEAVTA